MGTVVEAPHEIDHFMAKTGPATKLLLDTGHCLFGGGDPAELARKYMDRGRPYPRQERARCRSPTRSRPTTCPSSKACAAASSPCPAIPRARSTSPPVLKIAAEHGYSGWVVIEAEQDPAVRSPLLYQTMGLTALKAMAREAGLDRMTTLLRHPHRRARQGARRHARRAAGWCYVGFGLYRLARRRDARPSRPATPR